MCICLILAVTYQNNENGSGISPFLTLKQIWGYFHDWFRCRDTVTTVWYQARCYAIHAIHSFLLSICLKWIFLTVSCVNVEIMIYRVKIWESYAENCFVDISFVFILYMYCWTFTAITNAFFSIHIRYIYCIYNNISSVKIDHDHLSLQLYTSEITIVLHTTISYIQIYIWHIKPNTLLINILIKKKSYKIYSDLMRMNRTHSTILLKISAKMIFYK